MRWALPRRGESDERAEERSVDDVYHGLVRAILSRDLKPGMKLPEETIATGFSVNRVVVRAVLNRLHSESLVDIHKNRGAYVASPSAKEADDIFDLRTVLEKEVVARLAMTITPEQIKQLESQVVSHREAFRAGQYPTSRHSAEQFHLRMAEMVENKVLSSMLGKLITRSALVLRPYNQQSATECGIDEHEDILEAMRRRDPAAAAAAMGRHFEHIVERIRRAQEADDSPSLAAIFERYA